MKKIISLALMMLVFCGSQVIATQNNDKADKDAIVATKGNIDSNKANQQKLEEIRSNIKDIEEKLKTAVGDEQARLSNELMLAKEAEQKLEAALRVGIIATVLGVLALPKHAVLGAVNLVRNNPVKTVLGTAVVAGAVAAVYYYFYSTEEAAAKPARFKK